MNGQHRRNNNNRNINTMRTRMSPITIINHFVAKLMKAVNLTVCNSRHKVTRRARGRFVMPFDNLRKNLKNLLITKSTIMPQAKETIIYFISHRTINVKQV